jgi:hypothetical protein
MGMFLVASSSTSNIDHFSKKFFFFIKIALFKKFLKFTLLNILTYNTGSSKLYFMNVRESSRNLGQLYVLK